MNVTFLDDLCNPNPCGSNADCKAGKDNRGNDLPVCSCRAGYLGDPFVSCRRDPCIDQTVNYYLSILLETQFETILI